MAQFMFLYIFYKDKRIEKQLIQRFSDLSQDKSKFYYYEKPFEERGKGHCFKREDILCFEVSPYPLRNWEQEITKANTV